ncbi:MAG: hypothetical protein HY518_02365 [Candidatus Aenigmarchaeota archaeon]|nr:hypothetical protein [Candidatus Aenigmarchaeota archaeon]
MEDAVRTLRKMGEFHMRDGFLVYGNPENPRHVVLFEKPHVFQKAVAVFANRTALRDNYLFMCGRGVPSGKCLDFLKRLEPVKVAYFGDMDPVSFYTYLAYAQLSRNPSPKGRPAMKVRLGGITAADYAHMRGKTIKMSHDELAVLDFVERFRPPQLRKEIGLLRETGWKVEMEALGAGIEEYVKYRAVQG